jgi:hypothetical protein
VYFVQSGGCLTSVIAYRDKESCQGVFVRFRAASIAHGGSTL